MDPNDSLDGDTTGERGIALRTLVACGIGFALSVLVMVKLLNEDFEQREDTFALLCRSAPIVFLFALARKNSIYLGALTFLSGVVVWAGYFAGGGFHQSSLAAGLSFVWILANIFFSYLLAFACQRVFYSS